MIQKIKRNYHWVIAAVMLLHMFVLIGIYNNLSSVFILPVTKELQISRTAYSFSVTTMKGLAGFVSTFLSGVLLMKLSFRKSITLFMISNSVAFFLLSVSQNALNLSLCAMMLGLGNGICMSAGIQVIIRRWFHKHQGTVLGVVTASSGIGGSVMCILLSAICEGSSWRTAFAVCGGMVVVMGVLLCLLLRDRPEQMGLQPYGMGQLQSKKKQKQDWAGPEMKELVRKPAFYLMLIGTILSCLCAYTVMQSLMPHVRDIGFPESMATTLQSVMMILLTATKAGAGALSDRIGPKWVTMICLLSGLAALLLLTFFDSAVAVVIAVVLNAMGLPLTSLIPPLLAPNLFGYRSQTVGVGIYMAMISIASMACGPLVNLMFDCWGSYCPAYAGAAVLMAVTIAIYGLMYYLAEKDKKASVAL